MGASLITPRPTHGGLNWDTVIETDLAALRDGINKAVAIDGGNANSLASSGLYIGNTLANSPGGSANTFWIWENYFGPTTQGQIAMDYTTGATWTRKCQSGTWSAWRQLLDSSMDTGWVTASTGITAATGWTLVSAKYRILNNVAHISAQATKATGTITAASSGNLSNTSVFNLPANLQPSTGNGNYANTGANATFMAGGFASSTSAALVLTMATPSYAITAGAVCDLMGSHAL